VGLDVQQVADDRINRRHLRGEPFGAALLDQRETTREVGPFAQVEWPLSPHLRVTGGARYDAVRFDVADNLVAARGGVRTLDAFSGHAGVTWQRNALTAWSSVATSFETPTTTEFANRPDVTTGLNTTLGPQRSVSAELGVRTTVGAVALEAAGWRTETEDVITPVQEVGGRSFFANLGGSRTQGLELLANAPISGGMSAIATYTYTDARYTDDAGMLQGNRVAGIPQHLARVGVRGVVAGFALDADHAFSSSQFADDANQAEIADWGAGVTGMRVARTIVAGGGTARVFVAVQNLWARRYVGSVTVNGGFGRVAEPAAGRVVSAGVVVGR
jgi:iron complex outermembrane recepter protein